jgi:hypothetical protein
VDDGIRTRDTQIHNLDSNRRKTPFGNDLCTLAPAVAAYLPCDTCQTDPNLTAVIEAWDLVPEAVRASKLMLVRAASVK